MPDSNESDGAPEIAAFLATLGAREQSLFDAAERSAAALLQGELRLARVLEATASAHALGDEVSRHHLPVFGAEPLACGEGCHFCCHLKVSVTAPEVLVIAAHLAEHALRGLRERIAARAAELASDPRIFSADAKAEARIPCALLTEAGACSVYAVRPLACRGWNSTNAESCRQALDDDSVPIPMNFDWARECAAVSLGLRAAITAASFRGDILELTAALHAALSTPNALERWLAGEDVFAPARAPG